MTDKLCCKRYKQAKIQENIKIGELFSISSIQTEKTEHTGQKVPDIHLEQTKHCVIFYAGVSKAVHTNLP